MEKSLKTEILKLVQLQLGISDLNETDRLVEDLGAESADIANIIATAEEKFNVIFEEAEIAKISTPKDLQNLVRSKSQ